RGCWHSTTERANRDPSAGTAAPGRRGPDASDGTSNRGGLVMGGAVEPALFVTAALVLAGLRLPRTHTLPSADAPPRPPGTAVRLLRTEAELAEAVARAVEAEQRAAARSTARIDRYTRLLAATSGDSPEAARLRSVELAS